MLIDNNCEFNYMISDTPSVYMRNNPNIHKTRFAIAQFNSGEGPTYSSPIFLQLVDDPNGSYLRAAPLNAWDKIAKGFGYGSAAMEKVADHLNKHRELLFPDPLNHNYLQEKLGKKLISYYEKHHEENSPVIAAINELNIYLQSFEEQLRAAVANENSSSISALLSVAIETSPSPQKINLICKLLEEHPEAFVGNITAYQLERISPLNPQAYTTFLTSVAELYEALTKVSDQSVAARLLYMLIINRPAELNEDAVNNILTAYPQAKWRVVAETGLEIGHNKSIVELNSTGFYVGEVSKHAAFNLHFFEKHVASWLPQNLELVATLFIFVFFKNGNERLKNLLSELTPGLNETLANVKDANGSGLLHHIPSMRSDLYSGIMLCLARHFNHSQLESIFTCNNQGVAPLHLFMQNIFSKIPERQLASDSDWKAIGSFIRYLPLSKLKENLTSNQQCNAKCLSNYLAEQLLSTSVGYEVILSRALENIPLVAFPYVFNFTLFRLLAKESNKIAVDTFKSVLKKAAAEDIPVIAAAYLAASRNNGRNHCYIDGMKYKDEIASYNKNYLKKNLYKPEFFQALLEYPSLAYSSCVKMPETFFAVLESIGGFQALPPAIQEKNCWLLRDEKIRAFIDNLLKDILDKEKRLQAPLPEYRDHPSTFLTSIQRNEDSIQFLADLYSPLLFVLLNQHPAYREESSAIFYHLPPYISSVVNLYLKPEIVVDLLKTNHDVNKQNEYLVRLCFETLVGELNTLLTLASESTGSIDKQDVVIHTSKLRIPVINSVLDYLDENLPSEQSEENINSYSWCVEAYNYLYENFFHLELSAETTYKPPEKFFDAIMLGSIMATPLIPPLKDRDGNPLKEVKERIDASFFTSNQAYVIDKGENGIFYKCPLNNQEYPEGEFQVDEALKNEIEEWKTAHPYWEEYLEEHP